MTKTFDVDEVRGKENVMEKLHVFPNEQNKYLARGSKNFSALM